LGQFPAGAGPFILSAVPRRATPFSFLGHGAGLDGLMGEEFLFFLLRFEPNAYLHFFYFLL
jgi:hypothetical protein